jgi:hypothetical protein
MVDPILPSKYQSMLKMGMDVDWAKTLPGRIQAQKAHDGEINVPLEFKKRGISHVRIRVTDDVRNTTVNPKTGRTLLQEITVLVDDCLKADLLPIIAYQAADFKKTPTDDAVLQGVVDWWTAVANNFKGYSYKLAYNFIIETTEELKKNNDRLNLCYQKVSDAIRAIDPCRIGIVAPNKISDPYELDRLVVPTPTQYMMVEWHFYAAGPQQDNPAKKWTMGTDEEKKLITDKIAAASNWSLRQQIPTWVGAWMANNYNEDQEGSPDAPVLSDGAPGGGDYTPQQQIAFAAFMSSQLQQAGIPYAVNSDTKFYNRTSNAWYESMATVLDEMIWK